MKVTNKKTKVVYEMTDAQVEQLKKTSLAQRFAFEKPVVTPPEVTKLKESGKPNPMKNVKGDDVTNDEAK